MILSNLGLTLLLLITAFLFIDLGFNGSPKLLPTSVLVSKMTRGSDLINLGIANEFSK